MARFARRLSLLACGALIGALASTSLIVIAADDPSALPTEALRNILSAFRTLRSQNVDPLDDRALIDACIAGMTQHADPEGGVYYTADDLAVPASTSAWETVLQSS